MKRIVWIVIGVVVLGGIALSMRPHPVEVKIGHAEKRTVREYIADEAKVRLDKEYLIDMPVAGTVETIVWKVGDVVESGQELARIDPYPIEQQINGVDALIEQARARIEGVDATKTKVEDIDSAAMRVKEMTDTLRIAERELGIARTERDDAKRVYERAKNLLAQGVASQSDFDQAERRYSVAEQQLSRGELAADAARKTLNIAELGARRVAGSVDDNEYMREVFKAEIESLEAQKALLEDDLKKAVIHAPVRGPILEKYVENRRVMALGAPLIKMGDLSTTEIECDVLSEEVVRVREGVPVEISGKAIETPPVPGTVKRIYPSAFMKVSALGIEQQRVKTLIDFDNTALQLRPGTRLDVRIITAESPDTLAVPERATFREGGQWYVFAVERGHARKAAVTLGLKNDEWAEVTEGLSLDNEIVTDPTNELAEGVRVTAAD